MTLVEGFEPDAIALAALLAREGRAVTIAGPNAAPPPVRALRELGVEVREHADLDADTGEHDEAFLDVWTPEVAPRVVQLRAAGCRVRCLADLVLERARVPTIGITGTAGKTTAAIFAAALLRGTGTTVHASTTARAGNLWPSAELLAPVDDGIAVLELTSSHLCFATTSPTIASVTSFWPDHLELHGSLARYRAAKEAIVLGQSETGSVVVNADDPEAVAIGSLSPGRAFAFSATKEVARGAFRRGSGVVLRDGEHESTIPLPAGLDDPRLAALLGAAAVTLAAGRWPTTLGPLPRPPFRAAVVGRRGSTELVDDGLAATPAKTAAALRERAAGSVVLVAGGLLEVDGLEVHATVAENELLHRACDEVRRAARLVILFGPAAERLANVLGPHRVRLTSSLDEAISSAARVLRDDDAALVVSPMFPLPQPDRERIASRLEELATTARFPGS